MNATSTAKTRLEDWKDRRQYLESLSGENPRKAVHIKVLDYLISRYRDSAVAQLPARFSLRLDLHWNDRRITVHHHLGRGKVAGVRNRENGEQRIADVLHRMMSCERSEDESFTPTISAVRPRRPVMLLHPSWRIKLGWNADRHIRKALARYPILPETCLKHLISRLSDATHEDSTALELLNLCKNKNIIERMVRAWRDRVAQGGSTGLITTSLEAQIQSPNHRPRAAELMRERLADDDAPVRVAACRLIAKIGDLDDIGLLSDLLALPESSDEDPIERDAIATAMTTIAERNVL